MNIIKYQPINALKIEGFIDKDLCDYLAAYSLHLASKLREGDNQTPVGKIMAYLPLYEALLDFKLPLVQELCHCKLFPTYSYGRIYRNGSILEGHRDRPACEFTVSLTIGRSEGFEWPLYLLDKNNEKHYVSLSIGDALLYKGCETVHGRDPLVCQEDEYLIQIFLHYVDAAGPSADQKY